MWASLGMWEPTSSLVQRGLLQGLKDHPEAFSPRDLLDPSLGIYIVLFSILPDHLDERTWPLNVDVIFLRIYYYLFFLLISIELFVFSKVIVIIIYFIYHSHE